ncbi:hypothetical protein [Mameliella alba]|uniref:hypothetical protein n=1 Tax=Mameliella alba TaxID=561184 RepID=UPI001054E6D2|nr:hypothetical protein [Mameliella alba]
MLLILLLVTYTAIPEWRWRFGLALAAGLTLAFSAHMHTITAPAGISFAARGTPVVLAINVLISLALAALGTLLRAAVMRLRR